MGASILFRRHYAYAAVSLVAAIVIHDSARLVSAVASSGRPLPQMRRAVLEWAVVGAAMAGTLLTLRPAFLTHLLAHDYYELYRSFLMSPREEFGLFRDFFGRGFWVLSLGGWFLAWRSRVASPTAPGSWCFWAGRWGR